MATIVEHADLKCPECNAAIDPPVGDFVNRVVACAFCGRKIRFRRDPQPRPSAGVAIQVALPKWHAERYRPGPLAVVLPLVILLVLAGAGAGVWFSLGSGARATRYGGGGGGGPTVPIVCTGTQRLDDQTLRGSGPLIDARDGCVLTVAGSRLQADGVAISAQGTAKVDVSNGTITASGAAAVTASGSARVGLDNTTINGAAEGVVADGEAHITLTNCTVNATRAAVRSSGNGKVEAGDSNTLNPRP